MHEFSVDQVVFRTERQTLRRLPRSGAIVFTIRTYLESATQLCKEPGIPEILASAIRSMPPEVLQCVSPAIQCPCLTLTITFKVQACGDVEEPSIRTS